MNESAQNPVDDDQRQRSAVQAKLQGPGRRRHTTALAVIMLLLVVPAAWLVVVAFSSGPDITRTGRLLLLSLAAVLLALPCRIVWVLLRRRRKTGRWTLRPTQEERVELAAKWSQPVRPQVRYISTALYVFAATIWVLLIVHEPHNLLNWVTGLVFVVIAVQNLWQLKQKSTLPLPLWATPDTQHSTDSANGSKQDPPTS
jgi:hypothetical protein